MYSRDVEIRRMTSADVYKLGQILEPTNSWKKLMQLIPKDPFAADNKDEVYKYNNDHIRLVENASVKQNRMATEILFDEWGTSGKKRPTLGILLDLLVKAELFRAADFVALNFLCEPPPQRPLKGPAAKIDISIPMDSDEIRQVEDMLNDKSYPDTETLNANANMSSTNNNKDYFEKMVREQKRMEIEASDLIEFSRTNASAGLSMDENIPRLSELIADNHDTMTTTADNESSDSANTLTRSANDNTSSDLTEELAVSSDIPMLSALDTQNSETYTNSLSPMLPDISVLNYQDGPDDEPNISPSLPRLSLDPSASPNHSNCSSISSNSNADECNNLAPILSLLDQRSSNNDSSLTNVTESSGENSFELSSSSQVSNENIPCLSALK